MGEAVAALAVEARRVWPDAQLGGRQLVRAAAVVALRSVATIAILLTLYYLIPVRARTPALEALWLALELLLFIGLLGVLVLRIIASEHPHLRAVSALSVVIPVFIIIFARAYLQVSTAFPHAFSTRLDQSTALYFTVTTFTTTGFGDITARSDGTRLLVTAQMVLDLVVLATTAKLLFGAAARVAGRVGPPPGGSG
jgi:hypothetical protein